MELVLPEGTVSTDETVIPEKKIELEAAPSRCRGDGKESDPKGGDQPAGSGFSSGDTRGTFEPGGSVTSGNVHDSVAAYEQGRPWLKQLKEYLAGNLAFVREYLKEHLPEISLVEPEGTYLIWLDFRALGLTESQREELIVNKAHLWLDSGVMFGVDGEGFERINIACPRATLEKALSQLKEALHGA